MIFIHSWREFFIIYGENRFLIQIQTDFGGNNVFDIEKVCIIGGDLRQVYLGRQFTCEGKFVTYYALELCPDAEPDYSSLNCAVSRCDTVILPMPVTADGKTLRTPLSEMTIPLDDDFAKALYGKRVFCGGAAALSKTADYSDVELYDYLAREELAVGNAVPTAEGAIAAAIDSSPKTLHASRCLVAGFGRIGKVLARDLAALGAKTTVSARNNSDLAWIKALGYTAVHTDNISESGEYDFIFNTIPAMIFDINVLEKTARHAVVTDLASKPGGVDLEACEALHIHAFPALSLPGKTAPETAAAIIKDTIDIISREEYP